MWNEKYKKKTIDDLVRASQEYNVTFNRVVNHMARLHQSRLLAIRTLRNIDGYLHILANKPRKYELQMGDIQIRYHEFNNRIAEIKKMSEETKAKGENPFPIARTVGGIGTAATLAPPTAMAVAMTFGTASTGVAISSLSGIAATNAALSWLGGGAIAAGGAGIVGGQALLAGFGPAGLVIGGIPLTANLLMTAIQNKEIARKAEEATVTILRETNEMKKIDAKITAWNKETVQLTNQLSRKYACLRRKRDYMQFTEEDKNELTLTMNMAEVLSKKIGEILS